MLRVFDLFSRALKDDAVLAPVGWRALYDHLDLGRLQVDSLGRDQADMAGRLDLDVPLVGLYGHVAAAGDELDAECVRENADAARSA